MFENVQQGPPDPMFDLKKIADADISDDKVDVGVGVYRNEEGKYHELQCIKAAKQILNEQNPGHDYELTTGNADFTRNAAALMFGRDSAVLAEGRTSSVQTISGTGANHLGALFLRRCLDTPVDRVHLGTPAWGNYVPLCGLVGLEVIKYRYYDDARAAVDFESCIEAVRRAPKNSVFILQGCCHNPTGTDLTKDQWRALAQEMKAKECLPFFDIAYQGLGGSMEDDAFAIRLFADAGFEMIVCQSFSKNFGLYGERCGVLHVVNKNHDIAVRVQDQFRCLIRWEFSSSPAYGSRLVNIVLEDDQMKRQWLEELSCLRERLSKIRSRLFSALVDVRKTPGSWSGILSTKGLFCFLPLSPIQCQRLVQDFHVYMPQNGRVNLSGLNEMNIETFADAIHAIANPSMSAYFKRNVDHFRPLQGSGTEEAGNIWSHSSICATESIPSGDKPTSLKLVR